MQVLRARNVHEALPRAMQLLQTDGFVAPSRNGDVLRMREPVATVYERPQERVEFHPWRDSNPFFHFYESLWMLAGRRDVAPLARYAKQMEQYSDDGAILNAAYGHRWRHAIGLPYLTEFVGCNRAMSKSVDQLIPICDALRKNADDRQQVLQIWDHRLDLGTQTKDHACNLTATFQVLDGRLNMVVFCRSNDVIWGCYGANAVHFSTLQEYVARRSGYEIGTYTQISVNWHAYVEVYDKMREKMMIIESLESSPYDVYYHLDSSVRPHPIAEPGADFDKWDLDCRCFVQDDGRLPRYSARVDYSPFFRDVAWPIVAAHDFYKDSMDGDRIYTDFWTEMYTLLDQCQASDWRLACRMWMMRRQAKHSRREKNTP